jgi:hypothetical protein
VLLNIKLESYQKNELGGSNKVVISDKYFKLQGLIMNEISLPPVKQGDTWNFKFAWKNQTTPINLSHCTARMQLRDRRTDAMIAEATTANNGILINGPLGEVSVTYPASVSVGIVPGTYVSDLELTFTDTGTVQSSNTLNIVVIKDISR